jgi:hypothetical protein
MTDNYAVIFLAWGEPCINEAFSCIRESRLPDVRLFLITDRQTQVPTCHDVDLGVIRADFQQNGLLRKTEIGDFIPSGFDAYLFLDCETRVLGDILLGFQKARQHGMAMVQAPHYSLDYFFNFDRIMQKEKTQLQGQMQYNTGVIFFTLRPEVVKVFTRWKQLARTYADDFDNNDQPYLSLAMEQLQFNPYTLSPSYNYRAVGELISGPVRIWHSYEQVPAKLNEFVSSWPLRRVERGKVSTVDNIFTVQKKQGVQLPISILPEWVRQFFKGRRNPDESV